MPTFEQYANSYPLSTFTTTRNFGPTIARIKANQARYEQVEELTGVPWYFIGALHYRESNCDFSTHLHNGDPLTARTKHVPRGYPKAGSPPFTWEESAVDALKIKGLDKIVDWNSQRMCYEAERFNGFGYRPRKVNSPYLWAGTNVYTVGKYVSDGNFDRTVVDTQLGVVPIFTELSKSAVARAELVASSRKLTLMQRLRNAIVGLVSSVMALDWLDMIGKVKQYVTDHAGIVLVVGAASIWAIFKLLEGFSIQDYKDGRYTPSKEDSSSSRTQAPEVR